MLHSRLFTVDACAKSLCNFVIVLAEPSVLAAFAEGARSSAIQQHPANVISNCLRYISTCK